MTLLVHVERLVDPRKATVAARTVLGPLVLHWKGEPAPASGAHDVELDVPDALEWGREIWRAADGVPPHHPTRGQRLAGTLLGIDELGVATIDVAEGFLLVDTFGDPPLGTVGEVVELAPLDVHAHPVHS